MRGIILAGGAGSRLYPLTMVASKQLQPVYDKPMIYYPLTTLMEGGVSEFCLISTPQDLPRYKQLFANASSWGISIEYREQAKPSGIAEAFVIAADFIGIDDVALILGDNIFYGSNQIPLAFKDFNGGATVFAYEVKDPQRYGVVEFNHSNKPISIEEKPTIPKSNFAIPGLYLFECGVVKCAKLLKPSARGELEITDLIRTYLNLGKLRVSVLERGVAWLDAGTSTSLHESSAYVQTIEKRQGIKIGCPEEVAYRCGFIDEVKLREVISSMPKCEYREYLEFICSRIN